MILARTMFLVADRPDPPPYEVTLGVVYPTAALTLAMHDFEREYLVPELKRSASHPIKDDVWTGQDSDKEWFHQFDGVSGRLQCVHDRQTGEFMSLISVRVKD